MRASPPFVVRGDVIQTTVSILPRMRAGSRSSRRPPDAELDVLAALRRARTATAAELTRALADTRPISHASVLTLLGRLEDRGLVRKRKADHGKAFVFRPSASAEGALRSMVDRMVRGVFGGDRFQFVASFLESARPTPDEVDRLEDLLRDLRAGRQRKPTARAK